MVVNKLVVFDLVFVISLGQDKPEQVLRWCDRFQQLVWLHSVSHELNQRAVFITEVLLNAFLDDLHF